MEEKTVDLQRESFSCAICLDLLKDPVTLPCGHNYCLTCIKGIWDGGAEKNVYRCPQCTRSFTPRPLLQKNTMLAELVEQLDQTPGAAATAAAVCCYAGPEDVTCDVCSGRKMKAHKSCQVCLVSFCDRHLRPHLTEPAFRRHRLVDPAERLEENLCSRHHEVMKIYCRTDHRVMCYLCAVDSHKDHDTISAASARGEQEKEAGRSRGGIQQRVREREKEVRRLQQEEKNITASAEKAVKDSDQIFEQMTTLLQRRKSGVEREIRSQQEANVGRLQELQEGLRREITELKDKDAELEKLSHMEDDNKFLLKFASLSEACEDAPVSRADVSPHSYSGDVAAAVAASRDQLQDFLRDTWANMPLTPEERLLLEAEPETRAQFLRHARDLTLDPNTAHYCLSLSKANRKVRGGSKQNLRPKHPDRFMDDWQVLSKETLTGRCYWEVKWTQGVSVAVASRIRSPGESREFGLNATSWSFCWTDASGCRFIHGGVTQEVQVLPSPRVGVYLDHSTGLLSFYSVSETMTLLHRVQTRFSEPLCAGVRVGVKSSCEFLDLN